MELKEKTHLPSSPEINFVSPSERNHSDDRKIYDVILSSEDDLADTTIDSQHSNDNDEKQKFGNVSTLDWLTTWRSVEIS